MGKKTGLMFAILLLATCLYAGGRLSAAKPYLDKGLVVGLHLDGNANAYVGNNWGVDLSTAWNNGVYDKCFFGGGVISGTSGFLRIYSTQLIPNPTNDWWSGGVTIMCWINPRFRGWWNNNLQIIISIGELFQKGKSGIFICREGQSKNDKLLIRHRYESKDGDFAGETYFETPFFIYKSNNDYSYDGWVHLTYTGDSTNRIAKVYKNGVMISSESYSTNYWIVFSSQYSNHYIGASSFANNIWFGDIDEVAIFNKVLTDQEIKEIYQGTEFRHKN